MLRSLVGSEMCIRDREEGDHPFLQKQEGENSYALLLLEVPGRDTPSLLLLLLLVQKEEDPPSVLFH